MLPEKPIMYFGDNTEFLDSMVGGINTQPSAIKAIVLGGYYPEEVLEYLADLGVDVVGCFQDYKKREGEGYGKETKKDVIVDPFDDLIAVITKKNVKRISMQDPQNPFEA